MGKCFCARSQKEKVQSEPVYCTPPSILRRILVMRPRFAGRLSSSVANVLNALFFASSSVSAAFFFACFHASLFSGVGEWSKATLVAPHPRRARKVDHKAQTADGWFGARGDTVPQCLWCCVAASESLGYDYCGVASRFLKV